MSEDDPFKRPVFDVEQHADQAARDVLATVKMDGDGPLTAEDMHAAARAGQRLYAAPSVAAMSQAADPNIRLEFGVGVTKDGETEAAALHRLLAIKSGKMRPVGMDERVDLAAMSAGGKTPQFHVVKKDTMDAMERKWNAALVGEKLDGFDMGAVASRIRDNLTGSPNNAEQAADALDAIMQAETSAERFRLLDNLEPGEWSEAVMHAMKHMTAEQMNRYALALKEHDRSTALKIVEERIAEVQKRLAERKGEIANLIGQKADLDRRIAADEDLVALIKNPILQKLGETGYHKLLTALRTGDLVQANGNDIADLDLMNRLIPVAPHCFVVQHDWAAAFAQAKDFDGGEVKFPYDEMVFEFRVSGRRTCLCTDTGENAAPSMILFVETTVGWSLADAYSRQPDGVWKSVLGADPAEPLFTLCMSQVRAMLIALEAEVAVTEVVRAPHRLNAKREKAGKVPIFDHHVVNLAHRKRYLPRDVQEGELELEHARKRMHFVRGHWRHFTNSKTYIKWHLRGDPDLGFIDKHYRL